MQRCRFHEQVVNIDGSQKPEDQSSELDMQIMWLSLTLWPLFPKPNPELMDGKAVYGRPLFSASGDVI